MPVNNNKNNRCSVCDYSPVSSPDEESREFFFYGEDCVCHVCRESVVNSLLEFDKTQEEGEITLGMALEAPDLTAEGLSREGELPP